LSLRLFRSVRERLGVPFTVFFYRLFCGKFGRVGEETVLFFVSVEFFPVKIIKIFSV
jgi:hypothetical protein